MPKKQIPRKWTDTLQVAIFITILFLFASYESSRKANNLSQLTPSSVQAEDSTFLQHSEFVTL